MKKGILILFLFAVGQSYGQSNLDFNHCLLKITEIEDLQPILFSLENKGVKVLCIEGETYKVDDVLYFTDRNYFLEHAKKPVHVESRAFIEMFQVGYWLQLDSVNISENNIEISFITTSLSFDSTKSYIHGNVKFFKDDGNWNLKEKPFFYEEYTSSFEKEKVKGETFEEERERIKKMYELMIKEAKENKDD